MPCHAPARTPAPSYVYCDVIEVRYVTRTERLHRPGKKRDVMHVTSGRWYLNWFTQ